MVLVPGSSNIQGAKLPSVRAREWVRLFFRVRKHTITRCVWWHALPGNFRLSEIAFGTFSDTNLVPTSTCTCYI